MSEIAAAYGAIATTVTYANPATFDPNYIACIPARNEATRIAACLTALDREFGDSLHIILLVNDSFDETTQMALAISDRFKCALTLVDIRWQTGTGSAPRARALAFGLSQTLSTKARLFSTDADTIVMPGLKAAYDEEFAAGFQMVCGRIGFIAEEAARLPLADPKRDAVIRTYRDTSRQITAIWHPDADNPLPHHGNIGGANFAVTGDAYAIAGPLPIVVSGEDRALRRRFEAFGLRVRYSNAPFVETSCRIDSLTPGGLSAELRRNRFEEDPLVDELLEPPSALLRRLRFRTAIEQDSDRTRVAFALTKLGIAFPRSIELAERMPAKMAWFCAERELTCLARSQLRFSSLARYLPGLIRLKALSEAIRPGSPATRVG